MKIKIGIIGFLIMVIFFMFFLGYCAGYLNGYFDIPYIEDDIENGIAAVIILIFMIAIFFVGIGGGRKR